MKRTWMKALVLVAVGLISALVTEDANAQGPIRRMFRRPFRRDNNVVYATTTQTARAGTPAAAQPGGSVAPAAATTDANANRDANVRPATAEAELTTPAATPAAAAPQLTVQPTSSSPRGIPILRRLRWRD